jgi:ubiquinone/menaquinone biosynthesis C-methylase UbiE
MIDRALLEQMRRDWDARAKENARHYVATGQHDWTDDDFFRTGAEEVHALIEDCLDDICNGRDPAKMNVLEIGCGAGRMTLPLSRIFGHVDAVDVSEEMIGQATRALRGRINVGFHSNNGSDLSMFPNAYFDFALSAIVFQHIPRRAIVENYVRETHRVLRSQSIFKLQVQGFPIPEDQADTWVGVGFSEEQMQAMADAVGFQIKASQGAGTQYYWLTFLKP